MFVIPDDRLPPGFADTIQDPPDPPATARPAATTVLLRDHRDRLEVLLMQRHRRSGFVPGAWVFPGGRVDPGDHASHLGDRIRGLPREPVPEPAFWAAALRELFEETGVLLARDRTGGWAPHASGTPRIERSRGALMDDAIRLPEVLVEHDLVLDARAMVHLAHWVTPVVEPRRYDTHFFAVAIPDGREAVPDPREMSAARWFHPVAALERFERGELPMVFPTVRTLQTLTPFRSTGDVLTAFRDRAVPRILPRLVRTEDGVGIVVDEP